MKISSLPKYDRVKLLEKMNFNVPNYSKIKSSNQLLETENYSVRTNAIVDQMTFKMLQVKYQLESRQPLHAPTLSGKMAKKFVADVLTIDPCAEIIACPEINPRFAVAAGAIYIENSRGYIEAVYARPDRHALVRLVTHDGIIDVTDEFDRDTLPRIPVFCELYSYMLPHLMALKGCTFEFSYYSNRVGIHNAHTIFWDIMGQKSLEELECILAGTY